MDRGRARVGELVGNSGTASRVLSGTKTAPSRPPRRTSPGRRGGSRRGRRSGRRAARRGAQGAGESSGAGVGLGVRVVGRPRTGRRCGPGSCGPCGRARSRCPSLRMGGDALSVSVSVGVRSVSSQSEAEEPGRVLLEDLRADLVLDLQLLEVGQPAVGREDRVVGAEEDLVLEQRVGVLDELRREVLRGPAGEVDVHARLVRGHRQGLVLPGEGRVGEDDLQLGEVGGDVVDAHRVGVLQADARHRPGTPAPMPVWPVWKRAMAPVSSITSYST